MKIFLSHSSRDKDFVDVVARKLGRNQVVYDRYNFMSGHDFVSEIESGLAEATHFVLLASRAALNSDWVQFELDELRYRRVFKGLPFLVLIIDRGVVINDLPRWLTHGKVETAPTGDLAFRAIETFCTSATPADRTLFMGREDLLGEFSKNLAKQTTTTGRRIFAFTGLGGVGRRTFAAHAIRSYLGQQIQILVTLGPHDSLIDLYAKLLQLEGEEITVTSLGSFLRVFRSVSPEEQASEVARLLNEYAKLNFAPCMIDNGAMLDPAGRYYLWAQQLITACIARGDLTLILVHERKPQYLPDDPLAQNILVMSVPSLPEPAMRSLLQTLVYNRKITTAPEDIEEIVPYLDGYPPAAIWTSELAHRYGMRGLLADKSVLIDIKVRTFARLLDSLELTPVDWQILRLLAGQPLLPIDALAAAISIEPIVCIAQVRKLVDYHLIEPVPQGFAIARPIRDAVGRVKGFLEAADYVVIAKALCASYWSNDVGLVNVDILSATIHAVARAGGKLPEKIKELVLPSALHAAAESAYHSRDWPAARRIAEQALVLDPHHIPSAVILFKSLVRQDEFGEADNRLKLLEDTKLRELKYLHGFLEWKRGNLPEAIRYFRSSIASNYATVPVYRDLAHCLHFTGDHPEALKAILKASEASRVPNKFVIDLAAKIAIDSHDYKTAGDYIEQLRAIDTLRNVQHREASLRAAQGNWRDVLRLTEGVSIGTDRAELVALRISALIDAQQYEPAEELLVEFERIIGRGRRDICNGLWCKLRLRQNLWRDANGYWQRLEKKGTDVQRALRVGILKQMIDDPDTSMGERQHAREELKRDYADVECLLATEIVIIPEEEIPYVE